MGVSSEIEMKIMNWEDCKYIIIIGSDGLTDYIEPDKMMKDLVQKINSKRSQNLICFDILEIAKNKQIQESIEQDDITAILSFNFKA